MAKRTKGRLIQLPSDVTEILREDAQLNKRSLQSEMEFILIEYATNIVKTKKGGYYTTICKLTEDE